MYVLFGELVLLGNEVDVLPVVCKLDLTPTFDRLDKVAIAKLFMVG